MTHEANAGSGNDGLSVLQNEMLRRIGRNLLLFQQVEILLKFLLANASIETGPSGPPARLRTRQEALKTKTLGQVSGQFFEELRTGPFELPSEEHITEIRIRSSFHISPDDAARLISLEEKFEAMTSERNELVHHFLERCNLSERSSIETALLRLDEQRGRALPLHQELQRLHDSLIEGRKLLVSFFQSPEGEAAIRLMHLQSSRIVTLLANAAQKLARDDGWTLLSSAGRFVSTEDPEQLPMIKRRFGHRGLQSLIAAAEIFELYEEATPGGGKRTLYRIKPGTVEFT